MILGTVDEKMLSCTHPHAHISTCIPAVTYWAVPTCLMWWPQCTEVNSWDRQNMLEVMTHFVVNMFILDLWFLNEIKMSDQQYMLQTSKFSSIASYMHWLMVLL